MSTEEVFVQHFAKLFVHYRDALTPDQSSLTETQPQELNQLSGAARDRMVAAARLALMEIESTNAGQTDRSRYFAKPGEAEWGC